jgi:hypothetical protein
MSDIAKGNKPWNEVRDGTLKIAMWKNESEKGPWYQSSIRNAYKDKATGEWKDTDNLDEDDLLKLIQLAQEAYASIRSDKRAHAMSRKEKKAESAAA